MSFEKHEGDYKPDAWENYTLEELGRWVHLLCKNAGNRSNTEKRDNDLYDARNYLEMMKLKIDKLEQQLKQGEE